LRDLNLGPDSKKLVERFRSMKIEGPPGRLAMITQEMATMLDRWITVGWCWPDACPATICGGPHFKVRYEDDKMGEQKKPIEVIEPYSKIGTTFPEVPYHVINP
jgi:hypothetical protein